MRLRWLVVAGLGTALAAACGGGTSDISGGGDDAGAGSETGATGDGGGTTPNDAAVDDGGEVVTDGGFNIDPDAGPDDAGLPDGGACNTMNNIAQPVVSTCISVLPNLNGGALVSGTYTLEAVAAIGTLAFCQNQFVPTGFKETLVMTVAPDGSGTLETVFEVGGPPEHHRTSTLVPGPNNTSPATGTNTCPSAGTGGPVRYASRVSPGGKQILQALLPYGKGAAVYRFVKQ